MQLERRIAKSEIEVRENPTGGITIRGHAAVFNSLSQNLGGFVERIQPGAFRQTISSGGDVVALFNHDSNFPLGRLSAGTLRLSEDARGLAYEIDLPNTSYARDLAESMQRGDVRHSSFAWSGTQDEWGYTDEGFPLRTVSTIRSLQDVSPVVNPAYLDTDSAVLGGQCALKSLAESRSMLLEDVMRLAAANELGQIISPASNEERSEESEESEERSEPGETHSALAIYRRRLELIELESPGI